MRSVVPTTDYDAYREAWDRVARAGYRHFNVDSAAAGHRYLSLTALALSQREARQLRSVTERFSRLLDRAVEGVLADREWWSALAWPWAAIELARQEPSHPDGRASLYGRFDYLLDANDAWQVVEYNADTPSGGREAGGFEPAIARLHPELRPVESRIEAHLTRTIVARTRAHSSPVKTVGIVSSHRWLEDLSQAVWLADLLERAGQRTLVGDVNDLHVSRGHIALRGQRIDALYRFYPFERLYRHAIFASLCEASISGRLLMLNGLRGFLAQSKACLAWLWANRFVFEPDDVAAIERHLPRTLLASHPDAPGLVPTSVVKHVNGREGDSVAFGQTLDHADWQGRLLEGGYVVQRAVTSPALADVEVDDRLQEVRCHADRYACVGGFAIGGRFGGCYTRLDGAITSTRATYVATLREAS